MMVAGQPGFSLKGETALLISKIKTLPYKSLCSDSTKLLHIQYCIYLFLLHNPGSKSKKKEKGKGKNELGPAVTPKY